MSLSIHHATRIVANSSEIDGRWLALTFHDSYGEGYPPTKLTVFFDYDISPAYAKALADAINSVPLGRRGVVVEEPPETCVGCGLIESECECAQFDSERK